MVRIPSLELLSYVELKCPSKVRKRKKREQRKRNRGDELPSADFAVGTDGVPFGQLEDGKQASAEGNA